MHTEKLISPTGGVNWQGGPNCSFFTKGSKQGLDQYTICRSVGRGNVGGYTREHLAEVFASQGGEAGEAEASLREESCISGQCRLKQLLKLRDLSEDG